MATLSGSRPFRETEEQTNKYINKRIAQWDYPFSWDRRRCLLSSRPSLRVAPCSGTISSWHRSCSASSCTYEPDTLTTQSSRSTTGRRWRLSLLLCPTVAVWRSPGCKGHRGRDSSFFRGWRHGRTALRFCILVYGPACTSENMWTTGSTDHISCLQPSSPTEQ